MKLLACLVTLGLVFGCGGKARRNGSEEASPSDNSDTGSGASGNHPDDEQNTIGGGGGTAWGAGGLVEEMPTPETGGSKSLEAMGGASNKDCALIKSSTEEIHLKNQADVDAFRSVGTVEASLFITGTVTDLSPLACLSHVKGDFGVYEAPQLSQLEGLEQLRKIDGALYIGHFCASDSTADCKNTSRPLVG